MQIRFGTGLNIICMLLWKIFEINIFLNRWASLWMRRWPRGTWMTCSGSLAVNLQLYVDLLFTHCLYVYHFISYHTAYSFKTALILIDIFRSWSQRKWASVWKGSWGVLSRGRASTWRTRSLTGRCSQFGHNTTADSGKWYRWKWIAQMWCLATTLLLISISTKAVLATYISSPHLLIMKQWLCIKPLLPLINTMLLLVFMHTAILQDQALFIIWNKMCLFFSPRKQEFKYFFKRCKRIFSQWKWVFNILSLKLHFHQKYPKLLAPVPMTELSRDLTGFGEIITPWWVPVVATQCLLAA